MTPLDWPANAPLLPLFALFIEENLINIYLLLFIQIRNVGFVPISALLLDQNDEATKFRCNSAIELTDYDRANPKKQRLRRLNRLPIQTIRDELKAHGLLSSGEIRSYLIKKYGTQDESNAGLTNGSNIGGQPNNQLNRSPISNLAIASEPNDLIDYNQPGGQLSSSNRANHFSSSTTVPNELPSLHRESSTLPITYPPTMPLSSSDLPIHSSLSTNLFVSPLTAELPAGYSIALPNMLAVGQPTRPADSLAPFLLINKSDLMNVMNGDLAGLEDELERELQLDEQANLLLNDIDRATFNFYRSEYKSDNISLNFFAYSICRLLDSPEKVNDKPKNAEKVFSFSLDIR